ncbi:formate/nitrite transporter family protein [Haloprofundus salilacus]|uniref:formate/nitrite transporter family protein n=1 Tax=Haloprofundus salilacus TaxID=2876190 RepID=UPI001CCEED72|nr:formate/nitrite transporter family protein [Haloprofundus salilacus]
MSVAPDPAEIFERAVAEGERRLDQSLLELVSTSFIAGFTVVFGIVTLGYVHGAAEPLLGEFAEIAGALAFGIAVVFLIVGRTELFTENFFDPTAKAVKSDSWMLSSLFRLWVVTFMFNLLGGGLFALVFSVEGALSAHAAEALRSFAVEFVRRGVFTEFANGVAGGALVALLSFLLAAVNSVRSRITVAYIVGFLLALGPFDHVVVTMLHVFFGVLFGADIGVASFAVMTATVTLGNFVGGLGLVTFTHVTQFKGARKSDS